MTQAKACGYQSFEKEIKKMKNTATKKQIAELEKNLAGVRSKMDGYLEELGI